MTVWYILVPRAALSFSHSLESTTLKYLIENVIVETMLIYQGRSLLSLYILLYYFQTCIPYTVYTSTVYRTFNLYLVYPVYFDTLHYLSLSPVGFLVFLLYISLYIRLLFLSASTSRPLCTSQSTRPSSQASECQLTS